jgi:hypothetical protein
MGQDTFRHEIFLRIRVNRDALLQLVEAKRKSLDTFMREAMARSKAGGSAGAGASAAR